MAVHECLSIVQRDHSDIRTMLGVLEATADRIYRRQRTDRDMVAGVARFFEQFAACHEQKEQGILLRTVEALCPPEERRILEVLRWNSSRGLRLLRHLMSLLRRNSREGEEAEALVKAAAEYATHVRAQLQEEDRWFARVLPRLTAEDDTKTAEDLRRLERQRIGATGREWFAQVVEDYRDIVASWGAQPRCTRQP